ncbi:hypothetical protein PP707_06445 [Acetobacter pasteurianus]|nr:hypothetical protein [Acetobacter pasteurianus]
MLTEETGFDHVGYYLLVFLLPIKPQDKWTFIFSDLFSQRLEI